MKTSKKLSLYILLLMACNNQIHTKYLKEKRRETTKNSGKKEAMIIENGDAKLRIGGIPRIEFLFYNNSVLLNSSIPDQAEFFKQTLDFYLNYSYGEKKYGHKALEAIVEVRNKNKWGTTGVYAEMTSTDIKIDNAILGDHKHVSSRPLIWFRTAWLKATWNAIFNIDSEKIHFFKLGWFPFKLGRGISFGSNYGATKDYLGLYSRYEDKYAPGILLSGELLKDKFKYDLYYSKIEERGSSIWDTYNNKKAYHTNRRTNPWSGVAKDSDLFAAKCLFTPFNRKRTGRLDIEPYGFYVEASDQTVEFAADSKAELATFGLNIEYKKNSFEFGAEAAINTGHERLYPIDRNIVELKRWDLTPEMYGSSNQANYQNALAVHGQGLLREVYNKVGDTTGASFVGDPLTEANKPYVTNSRYDEAQRNPNKDKSDRFRNSYKNSFCGWFALADMSYLIKSWNLRIAASYGYASGDSDPHEIEQDKNYSDFIGLNEWYCGKRVPSIFLLCEKIIPQPLSITPNTKSVKVDNHFSNLQHFGFGVNWKPKISKNKTIRINPNALFFWRTSNSLKYDVQAAKYGAPDYKENFSNGKVTGSEASKFLGTEVNLIVETEPLPDFLFYTTVGGFIPGTFYKDIKGVKIGGTPNVFSELDANTRAEVNLANYRLGDDTAVFVDIGVKYIF